jgi:hypothetical protein
MYAVTITSPLGPLCLREVRQIIVEEGMDHPLIGRPVLGEVAFEEIQHLDFVRTTFTCTTSVTLARSSWRLASSLWALCQSSYSSPRIFQSLFRTCQMCYH